MTARLLPALALLLAACPKPAATTATAAGAPAAEVPAAPPAEPAPAAPASDPASPEGAAVAPATIAEPSSTATELGIPGDARRRFEDAVAMLTTGDAGRARHAVDILKTLAADYPDKAIVQYNLGLAHHLAGQTNEARAAWTRCTQVDATFAKAWLNLGVLSAREGRPDVALASFQAGIRGAPDNLDLRVATIGVLREMRRHDEALREAKAALAINAKAIAVYNHLALVYLDTNQLDLAKFILQKALADIDGAKGNAQVHAVLGEVYNRQGYGGDAIASFKKALELDPFQISALQYLANYHLDNRNFADAVPLLERATGIAPQDAGIKISLGIAYRGEGRLEDAKHAYQEALRLNPKDPEPHRNLAVLYGDYMKAYDAAVQAIEDYRKAGGGKAEELDAWVASIRKEQKKIEDRKRRDEERKRKEEEARRAAETAGQAAQPGTEAQPDGAAAPAQPAPAPAPAQPAGAPAPADNPWGNGG